MNRRDLLRALVLAPIFAPKFGRWFRRGSGLIVPPPPVLLGDGSYKDSFVFVEFCESPDFSGEIQTVRRVLTRTADGTYCADLVPADHNVSGYRYVRARMMPFGPSADNEPMILAPYDRLTVSGFPNST